MKVFFSVKFNSTYGQNIYITGSCKELGNGRLEKAIPMTYSNNKWFADVEIKSKKFDYQYIIKDERDGSVTEEWKGRSFNKTVSTSKTIFLQDEWSYPNLPEFYQETKLFQPLNQLPKKSKSVTFGKHTHIFSIQIPLVPKDCVVCLLGNCDTLNNWQVQHPILMSHSGNGLWETAVDLSQVSHPIFYKYGFYNKQKKTFISFEEGENRVSFPTNPTQLFRIQDTGFRWKQNNLWRGSGVAIPVFSLRSEEGYGVGEFADLIPFSDWAQQAGLSLIQILPIHDTTATHSWTDSYPYAAISVYAFHPQFLRISDLPYSLNAKEKKVYEKEKSELNQLEQIDYEKVNNGKWKWIEIVFNRNKTDIFKDEKFNQYFKDNKHWLKPYAVFSVLRERFNDVNFSTWGEFKIGIEPIIDSFFNTKHADYDKAMMYIFVQWQLHEQLSEAIDVIHEKEIGFKGDLPIGIYRNSVEAWHQPKLFHMNQQAGAPPDDFAVLGQNWEFPTYNWDEMKKDNFQWWRSRLQFMQRYFDAYRIDHILGFFRIWQIPLHATQGILGRFEPALPITPDELQSRGIFWDEERLTKPYITSHILYDYFGEEAQHVTETYLEANNQFWRFKPEYDSQRKVKTQLGEEHAHTGRLLELHANVLFIKEENAYNLHPRFNLEHTRSFQDLDNDTKHKLRELYVDYFFHRQEQFWKQKGLEKLPVIKQVTDMLTCGEDLGLIPKVVPQVMNDLAILSLQIQRMPSGDVKFSHPAYAPYMCVVSPSSHDTSTLRQWWKENRENTQYFYNHLLGNWGEAPHELTDVLAEQIITQHLYSPAMLCVIPLQDWLAISNDLRNLNKDVERINVPAVFPYYWRYRIHLNIDDLNAQKEFNQYLFELNQKSGRN